MKKRLLNVMFWVVAFSFVFTSCTDDDAVPELSPDKVVRFLDGDFMIEVAEDSEAIMEIPVYINYPNEEPVEVYYSVEGDTSAFEILSESGVAVIPAGERKGLILLKPVDNAVINEGQRVARLRITGSNSDFDFPNDIGVGYSEKQIVFIDDECVPPVASSYTATVTALGGTAPEYEATVTQISENTYSIDSAWGPNFVGWATGDSGYNGQFPYAGTIVVNPDAGTIAIDGSANWATGGSGTIDCNGAMTYTLTQGLFTGNFTVDVSLSPN